MSKIGSLGDISFIVSSNQIKTFDEMSWNSSAKFATHDRHLRDDLLEFEGMELEEISFIMSFSILLGTNPLDEINKLKVIMSKGQALRLVLGNNVYGKNKWVIESLSKELTQFDNKGNLWVAKVSIKLKEYAKR